MPAHPKSLPSAAKLLQTDDDLFKKKQASTARLMNAWSSLIERYSMPIEEDDIIDIVTGEVVKDRGIISRWDKSQQGFFTNEVIGKHNSNKSSGDEEETPKADKERSEGRPTENEIKEGQVEKEREDDFDELDCFNIEACHPKPTEEEVQEDVVYVSDADNGEESTDIWADKMLEEFMEAEKRRKDLYGEDDHSSESDLEITRIRLRKRPSGRKFVESEDEAPYPPSSSPSCSLSSSPTKASSPLLSPSSRLSSLPLPPSLRPLRASLARTSTSSSTSSSIRMSYSSSSTSPLVRASHLPGSTSSSSNRVPSSSPGASSSKAPSVQGHPWLRTSFSSVRPSSSLAPPLSPSPRMSSFARRTSPDPPTSSSVTSSPSVRLSTPPLQPPPSSPIRSSSPPRPFSSPIRTSSFVPLPFESESEDELGVWDSPVGKKLPEPTKPVKTNTPRFKTPGPTTKRTPKRKRVVFSSEEETSDLDEPPGRSRSLVSSSTRARSWSPKKQAVDKDFGLTFARGDNLKNKAQGSSPLKSILKPSRHAAPER